MRALTEKTQALARAWWRGDWGKARWGAPHRDEAQALQTCPQCQAAFVATTKSPRCPDCG